jgi:hypothetical protein
MTDSLERMTRVLVSDTAREEAQTSSLSHVFRERFLGLVSTSPTLYTFNYPQFTSWDVRHLAAEFAPTTSVSPPPLTASSTLPYLPRGPISAR